MTIPETIFAEALERLHKGETPQQIAKDYTEANQQELEGLLSVAEMGMNIPRIEPPAPYKQFRFADKAVTSSGFMHFLTYMRVAVIPISLVIALMGGRLVVNATENSLPGDKLYSVKRATEEARLSLTRDKDKVAAIHVELLQKRLEDVRKAAGKGNEAGETAAIAELQSQTKITFTEVAPIATANAITKQDSSLLDTLVAVNKEQKVVLASLSEVVETSSAKTMAISAINDNKENDVTLAKIIASVNDQILTDLPNKTTVTGEITTYLGNKITVEKNTFTINERTIFTAADGTPVADIKLIKGKVTITGTRIENGTLIARQILVLPIDGTVKGDTIAKPTPKPNVTQPTTAPTQTEPEVVPSTPETPKATGGYIVEPSSPQYSQ